MGMRSSTSTVELVRPTLTTIICVHFLTHSGERIGEVAVSLLLKESFHHLSCGEEVSSIPALKRLLAYQKQLNVW